MLKHVFKPADIGTCHIPNRFVVPAMVLNYCREDGYPTERYISYHEARARGGWGLIITEDYAVDPVGKGYSHIPGFWEEGHVAPHSELPKRIHAYDSRIFAQIYHAGRQTNDLITGTQPVAPSPIPCPAKKQMPRELTVPEIEELVQKFGQAARRARDAGFDGVEIHGAHGYLIAQFLSAYSNKRSDRYGGSFHNRTRFALEIVHEVRKEVGPDYPLMFRISGDEFVPGGRTIEETKAVCMLLEQAGIDAIHVSAGVYGSRHRVVPPARMPHGHVVDHAREVKSVVSVPVVTVGWINDPHMAEAIVTSGKADFVAMGRASLADPELPQKARAGKFEEIIYCIGCMQGCAEKIRKAGESGGCMLNPLTGHETELAASPAAEPKRVLVAGGGIAGMEAAIVAAARGHRVALFERGDVLGGEFRLASVAPGKGEIASFLNWQKNRLAQLGVDIHLKTALSAEALEAGKPDVIIDAAGSVPSLPAIPGISGPNVVHAFDVLAGRVDVKASAIVIGGGMVGAETANHLSSHEKQVTIIEMQHDIALDEEANSRYLLLRDLAANNVTVLTDATVEKIGETTVDVKVGDTPRTVGPADTIIIALGATPGHAVPEGVSADVPVITVGDAKKVRKALEAIEEGYRAGLEV